MPENNPFFISTEMDKYTATPEPTPKLSPYEELRAELGLNPPSKTAAETNNPSTTEEFEVVDAIFTSTEPETTVTEKTSLPELGSFSVASDTSVETPLPTVAPEPIEQATHTVTEPQTQVQEATAYELPQPVAVKLLDRAGLEQVVTAYSDLQQKLAANQALISAERESIAELRNHMRQLNALGHELSDNREGLDLGRRLIQADSCENLMRSIGQVNEAIQQDSQRAAQLMIPLKAGVEVLELRIKHINAIENLLTHMEEGLMLQKQLSGANTLMHDLAKQLGLALN